MTPRKIISTEAQQAPIRNELDEMKKIGMNVPDMAYTHLKLLSGKVLDEMSVSDAADLCVNLA